MFLFRTLIEQWSRIATNAKADEFADQVLEGYMKTLPEDFKARFPSLRELYTVLSADLHRATGSVELFDKTRLMLVEHFTARQLFKLGQQEASQERP